MSRPPPLPARAAGAFDRSHRGSSAPRNAKRRGRVDPRDRPGPAHDPAPGRGCGSAGQRSPPAAAPGPEERPAARADPREGLNLLDSAWDFLGGQSRHMAGPEVTGSPARGRAGTAGAGSPRDPGQL